MNNFSFTPLPDNGRVNSLRGAYLDSIPFTQEYYLEILLEKANQYEIVKDEIKTGYFFLSDDNCLLEYYVKPENINNVDLIFGKILNEFSVKTALCKTFDAPLLNSCLTYSTDISVIGILFRELQKRPTPIPPPGLVIRKGIPADEVAIITVNEHVFDHPSEVIQYIRSEQIILFEINNNLAGFGIFSPVYPGRPEHDIGMLVTPDFRNKGIGRIIVRHLIDYCEMNGWKPSAGCAIENTASRRCLEKSGFVATHRLLEFNFNNMQNNSETRKSS